MDEEIRCLNSNFSTTRRVVSKKPDLSYSAGEKFESKLHKGKIDEGGHGGLRTRGIFKENTEDRPLVTVVTVVYNGAELLEETILSVIHQSYSNVEYIVIDGGSTDTSVDVIKKYEHAIDYWLSESDSGIYDAMNKALGFASGKWINFMNVGDVFANAEVVEGVSEVFISGHLILGSTEIIGLVKNEQISNIRELCYDDFYFNTPVHHQAIFHPLSAFKLIGRFNLEFKVAADNEWTVRFLNSGGNVTISKLIICKYLIDGFSAKNAKRLAKEKFHIAQKYFGRKSQIENILRYAMELSRVAIVDVLKNVGLIQLLRKIKYRSYN